MKYLLLVSSFILLALLTACSSIIGAIIGERPVENLFGLDGREIVFRLPQSSLVKQSSRDFSLEETLSPMQDISIPINVDLDPIPFNDLGELNFPLGAVPRAASEELGINGTVEVTSASLEAAFPQRLGLANPELDLTLADGSGTPSVRQQLQSPDVSVTFNKASCTANAGVTVCKYQADRPQEELFFFTLALEGQDFETVFNDILQAGAKTNNATGVITLVVSTSVENVPPVPLDSSFKLTLETRNGKIRFF